MNRKTQKNANFIHSIIFIHLFNCFHHVLKGGRESTGQKVQDARHVYKICIPFRRDVDQVLGSGMAQRMKRSKKKKKSSSSSSEQRRRKGGSGKKKGFLSRVFGWFFSFHVCTFYTLHFYSMWKTKCHFVQYAFDSNNKCSALSMFMV